MLKLERGYNLSITKASKDTTKQGMEYLKLNGAIYNKIIPFGEDKKILNSNYFGKIMLFGDSEYLEEVLKRVWALDTQEKEKSVKIRLDEAYVYNAYMRERKTIISMLIIGQSNFAKNPMKHKYEDRQLIGNYYLSPFVKEEKSEADVKCEIIHLALEEVDKPKAKRGRPKKVKEEVVEETKEEPIVEEVKEEPKEQSSFLADVLKNLK